LECSPVPKLLEYPTKQISITNIRRHNYGFAVTKKKKKKNVRNTTVSFRSQEGELIELFSNEINEQVPRDRKIAQTNMRTSECFAEHGAGLADVAPNGTCSHSA
jgi:hypothetical protein